MASQVTFYEFYTFFLCFMRIASIFLFIPLFSHKQILMQTKVSLALLLAIFVQPLAQPYLPNVINISYEKLFFHMLIEFSVGMLIGISGYILYMVLDIIGHFMGAESGLSNAQIFNPSMGETTSLTTHMLTIAGGVLLFNFQFHHTIINVIIHSYEYLDTSKLHVIQDFYEVLLNSLHKMFFLGLQFSFPFIIIGFVLNLSIGLVNKLIPQVQIFSVMPPAQLLVGFLLFTIVLSTLLEGFTINFNDTYTDLFNIH
jgi:flagellar biosynthetic protein FliR